MPRGSSSGRDSEEGRSRKNPRRGTVDVSYAENAGDEAEPMEVDSAAEEEPASSDEEVLEAEEDDDDDEVVGRRRSSRARKASNSPASKENSGATGRRSSRANKFSSSMKEPTDRDYLLKENNPENEKSANRRRKGTDDFDSEDDTGKSRQSKAPSKRNNRKQTQQQQRRGRQQPESPHKSPARRHKQQRMSISHVTHESDSDESSIEDDEEGDEEEPFKVQRIIAARTEPRNKWKEICANMNTSEIDMGSRWFQDPIDENDESFEERFLIKWADISYLHTSWETEKDLLEQAENAKGYLSSFFRKSENGLWFSQDERCDGDYFDPAWIQVDRILDVDYPEQCPIKTVKDEDTVSKQDLGIVLDKNDSGFEEGLGRQFLVKWQNSTYVDSTYEFERDLLLHDVEYKDQLKGFIHRRKKLSKDKARKLAKQGETEDRRLYLEVFGDGSKNKKEDAVEEYQKNLQEHVFKNGGQLRDYQAEGVSWMMANYVNDRCSILADEMGLGKTLQTCSFINLVATQFNRRGPFLIIAPLSTLAHWQREFTSWTDLNAIVYHGSAEDRQYIREFEFAHESDRPVGGVGFNQLYLKKCLPKKKETVYGNHWMVEVVITTPELLTADDYAELAAVEWECLVVDEAHRLKNHNSKLAVNLRDPKFDFKHKVLLTGTPIQNTMQELYALLNFVAPDLFDDCDEFMEKYGDMKSKETVDELHENLRPFILRRLKEDVEKSVPPKEETVIEVELTITQKQYYRALYEKNVKFLHKNKKKALDGPSLNNLAMQLRKCCNHLFLLNGIEEEYREKQISEGKDMSEGDLLVSASGKLVLLDKLLPRLKENGHRVLMFSQFKIMLDVLEDYLNARSQKFERIDGSITGKRRQQAIDRFQAPSVEGKQQPFIMLLSTRAGGVGINLTAADTCIIFDSDWNPQNDLQAQARCHRIGQTKSVKVYRLLTRKTYELQMFHQSSLKMGLDQAVLSGFETGSSGDGALSKDEVERLLRDGAYGIFTEENEGAEESNAFVQQDIDTILERRARTVIHENTGSKSSAAGGTFSKARFTAPATSEKKGANEKADIDVNDPDFWKKMVGEGQDDAGDDDLIGKRRRRTVMNYSEGAYEKKMDQSLLNSDAEGVDDDEEEESDDESYASDEEGKKRERFRWGGDAPWWKKDQAVKAINLLHVFGYGCFPWERFTKEFPKHEVKEVQRMCWSILLIGLCEIAEEDAAQTVRRAERAAEKKRASGDGGTGPAGGILAAGNQSKLNENQPELIQKCFEKLWSANTCWAATVLEDALNFARTNEPRSEEVLNRILDSASESNTPLKQDEVSAMFAQQVWPSLKSRGWKSQLLKEGVNSGKTQYSYEGKQYYSPEAVLSAAGSIHAELNSMVEKMLVNSELVKSKSKEAEAKLKEKHLSMKANTMDVKVLSEFLRKHAPLQLLYDRKSIDRKRLSLAARKMFHSTTFLYAASNLQRHAERSRGDKSLVDKLSSIVSVDKRSALPHPLWTAKHDGVLIHAIAKHGWIDNDKACRRIVNDETIKWGFPFDSDESGDEGSASDMASQRKDFFDSLHETAKRAATFLNTHRDVLKDLGTKGASHLQDPIVRHFCLKQRPNDDDDESEEENQSTQHRPWIVDEDALLASTGLQSAGAHEDVELPTKKDLVKRAKGILSKNAGVGGSQGGLKSAGGEQNGSKGEGGFCVLDQSALCNVLLAEFLRTIIRAPDYNMKAKKTLRMLCTIASQEAGTLLDSLKTAPPTTKQDGGQIRAKAAEEMTSIRGHIELAKSNFDHQSKQAKNVLRAVLALPGIEGGFPRVRSLGEKILPQNNSLTKKKEDGAVGDRALARAMAKCLDKNGGGPGRVSPEGHSSDLELTGIETLILSVICAQGIPVWTDNSTSVIVDFEAIAQDESSQSNFTLCWSGIGKILKTAARSWHESSKRKLEKCQADWKRVEDKDNSQARDRVKKNYSNAMKIEELKELVYSLAIDYAEDPEVLAKKTVMLCERIRKKMGKTVAQPKAKPNHGLGLKVFDFFSSQLSHWANNLDIADAGGNTLSYTAADFYHDIPAEEREKVEVTTVLSRQDCRQVVTQISLLSRLRSFFMKHSKDDLLAQIDFAASRCTGSEAWGAEPAWWKSVEGSPSFYDALLLESLVTHGFGDVLSATGFGPTGELALHEAGLTKAAIQQRANQLARELHALESGASLITMIDERRKNLKEDAGAANKKQTGLETFFARTTANFKPSSVVELSSDSEVDSPQQRQQQLAAKKSSNSSTEVDVDMAEAETQINRVGSGDPPGRKRDDYGSTSADEDEDKPSPGKKQRSSSSSEDE